MLFLSAGAKAGGVRQQSLEELDGHDLLPVEVDRGGGPVSYTHLAMDENGTCRELVKFGYSDFKMRLGRAAD